MVEYTLFQKNLKEAEKMSGIDDVEYFINDKMGDFDNSEDVSKFLIRYPPTGMDINLCERWNTNISNVDFKGSVLHGIIWDAKFLYCDLRACDLSNLMFRDYVEFRDCEYDECTVAPDRIPSLVAAVYYRRIRARVLREVRRFLIGGIVRLVDEYCDVPRLNEFVSL